MTFPQEQSIAVDISSGGGAGPEPLRVGSVCSGYEGLGMAVQSVLGGELAWVADNDPGASAILAHRFPSVPNLHDITSVNWATAEPVDIFTAGFPCQPVSLAGKRLGEADERWIWPDVARAIRDLRPRLVVLENVAALVARGLAGVSADLAAIGYVGSWRCIRASDVGAPHARNRVFIAAWPAADAAPAVKGWRDGTGSGARRNAPIGIETGAESRDRHGTPAEDPDSATGGERGESAPGQATSWRPRADTGGPGRAPVASDAGRAGLEIGPVEPDRYERQTVERGSGDAPADTGSERCDRGASLVGDGWPTTVREQAGGDHRDSRGPLAADTDGGGRWPEPGEPGWWRRGRIRAAEREQGDSTGGSALGEVLRILDWGAYAPAIARWEAVIGRPAPRPTEPGRTGERLSPRFVEWLMGLPDGWVTDVPGLTRNAQLKALGNGVVPQQAAAALRLLLPALERAA